MARWWFFSGAVASVLAGIFTFAFFAVIYGGLIYHMCTKAFQLVTRVPDRVLRWIGGGDS